MLCTLAIHLVQSGSCKLRVTGRTALGPSSTGGRDVKSYPNTADLLNGLEALGLGPDIVDAAVCIMSDPELRDRFINFADNVQISFDMLERAEIYLFD
jgi:hypothetical protein